MRDVARRPVVETGASVPGYSGGFAACVVVSDSELCLMGLMGQREGAGGVGGPCGRVRVDGAGDYFCTL